MTEIYVQTTKTRRSCSHVNPPKSTMMAQTGKDDRLVEHTYTN